MENDSDSSSSGSNKPFSTNEITATGTTHGGDRTQIIDLRNTKAGGRLLPIIQVASGADQGRIFSLIQTPRMTLGRGKESTLVLYDPSCSRSHAEIYLAPDETVFIRDMGSTNGTKVNGDKVVDPRQLQDSDRIQLGDNTILRFSLIPEDDARVQMDVYHRATRDALTGAYNRRQFDEFLKRELSFLKRNSKQGLGLIIFDIDHFKKINDSFGHLAGDEVLKDVGKRVPPCLRAEDIFARIGGEEFAIISRSDTLDGVKIIAERLREAMEKTPSAFEGRGIMFTISVGYTFVHGKSEILADILVGTADACLYDAKHGGRNRTVGKLPPDEPSTPPT